MERRRSIVIIVSRLYGTFQNWCFHRRTMVNQILRDNCHDRQNFSVENAISSWLATSSVGRVWRDGKGSGRSTLGAGWDYCRTCRPVWTWRNCPWKTLTFHFQSWQRAARATICIPLIARHCFDGIFYYCSSINRLMLHFLCTSVFQSSGKQISNNTSFAFNSTKVGGDMHHFGANLDFNIIYSILYE